MCGIFFYKGKYYFSNNENKKKLLEKYRLLKHRGPDSSMYINYKNELFFGFHRLSIIDIDISGLQPLQNLDCILICNGEIYNYKQLCLKFNIKLNTVSDCEIIIHLYKLIGIEKTLNELDGEFAFVLYDKKTKDIICARDHIGVRGLYYGIKDDEYFFSSELLPLSELCDNIMQFKPGHYMINQKYYKYFNLNPIVEMNLDDIKINLKNLLTNSVIKRLYNCKRKKAFLLSAGLDSLLVTYIAVKESLKLGLIDSPKQIHTFTIGLEGTEIDENSDLFKARKVAKTLGTTHHEFIFTEKDYLLILSQMPFILGTYDITTNRASAFNLLIALKVKECGFSVVFSGELSDEIFCSYRGGLRAKNETEFYKENVKMLLENYDYDLLRGDRTTARASLEARLPFSCKYFIKFAMSIPSKYKMFKKIGDEKKILRDAFKNYVPDEFLYRPKEAFSDAAGSVNRPPYKIIEEFVNKFYNDEDFEIKKSRYLYLKPTTKEMLYYRELFEKHYLNHEQILPHIWRHAFSEENEDPSAWSI